MFNLTDNQIVWAASHDWFVKTQTNADGLTMIVVKEDDGNAVWLGTFKALREWAGY